MYKITILLVFYSNNFFMTIKIDVQRFNKKILIGLEIGKTSECQP